MSKNTAMLMILDGFGINEQVEGNSVKLANLPHLNEILKKLRADQNYNYSTGTSGSLPEGRLPFSASADGGTPLSGGLPHPAQK